MKVLFIGAHADDIELSAGGTVKRFIDKGDEVYCLIVTKSNYTNYDETTLRTEEDASKEAVAALEVLGVNYAHIWNLNIETKHVTHCPEIIEGINQVIDTVKADLIITHNLADSHQDHIATAKCTLSAARNQKNIWMYESLYPSKLSNIPCKPMIYVDIGKAGMEKKIVSLMEHRSQFGKYTYWTRYVTALATVRGVENHCDYAEAFELIKEEYVI